MRFALFNNPIELAHSYWKKLVGKEDLCLDATCGNGKDTHVLAQLTQKVEAWDIQEKALTKTKEFLGEFPHITFRQGCHSTLPSHIEVPLKLAVYNLGYLPGGNKNFTTKVETTLKSLCLIEEKIKEGGAISVMCYPGHPEGAKEEKTILNWAKGLCQNKWCAVHHPFLNRKASPSLLLLQKQGNSSHTG